MSAISPTRTWQPRIPTLSNPVQDKSPAPESMSHVLNERPVETKHPENTPLSQNQEQPQPEMLNADTSTSECAHAEYAPVLTELKPIDGESGKDATAIAETSILLASRESNLEHVELETPAFEQEQKLPSHFTTNPIAVVSSEMNLPAGMVVERSEPGHESRVASEMVTTAVTPGPTGFLDQGQVGGTSKPDSLAEIEHSFAPSDAALASPNVDSVGEIEPSCLEVPASHAGNNGEFAQNAENPDTIALICSETPVVAGTLSAPDRLESIVAEPEDAPTMPAKYRLRARMPSVRKNGIARQVQTKPNHAFFGIQVRLLFETGGFCALTLMPERDAALPENIAVVGHSGKLGLIALEDNWYQDVSSPEIGRLLLEGVKWAASAGSKRIRWSLGGRRVYVLGPRGDLSGFVSTTRLVLGETHVVLCAKDIQQRVIDALSEAGATGFAILPQDFGAPVGWVAIRDVSPSRAVAADANDDTLNALRPLPDLEITFDGGIRLSQAVYLAGFPPKIRLHGQIDEHVVVLIDGTPALRQADGSFTSDRWDVPGDHTVFCAGTKRYSIEEAQCQWELNNVHTFINERTRQSFGITGSLVRPAENHAVATQFIFISQANPLLLGPEPGQIYLCSVSDERPGSRCPAFAPFDPVWAIPADPLHASKQNARIQLWGKPFRPSKRLRQGRRAVESIRAWCDAILNCGRKQLAVDPATPDVIALWDEYRQVARAIRRSIK